MTEPTYTVETLWELYRMAQQLGFKDDAAHWREKLIEKGEKP